MNSAAIYKKALRRKRTYSLVTVCTVLSALLATGGAGWWRGDQVAEEQLQETRILSNVPYAEYFIQYAPEAGLDWHMVAAVAYHESRYNPAAHSRSGACGIMQLMPRTAQRFGLNDSTLWEPEDNIRAGVHYIKRLQEQFVFIPDSAERLHFVLASYNAGPAHIHDARRLAREYGDNPYRWNDVETWLTRLDDPQYYNDSLVLYGAFRAGETTRYVHSVLRTYDRILAADTLTLP
ncbi:MAG: transglycosylase SLT domain-containing protein [Paludibacteraceae bacterium]|nr:transglycosylase SLT domain-containing protein [Paludibacteraceae bacterium]